MYLNLEKFRVKDSELKGVCDDLLVTQILYFDTINTYGISKGNFKIGIWPFEIFQSENETHMILCAFVDRKGLFKYLNISEFNSIALGLDEDKLSLIPDYIVQNCINDIFHFMTIYQSPTSILFAQELVDLDGLKKYYHNDLSNIVRRLCVMSKLLWFVNMYDSVIHELDDIFTEILNRNTFCQKCEILKIINKNYQ